MRARARARAPRLGAVGAREAQVRFDVRVRRVRSDVPESFYIHHDVMFSVIKRHACWHADGS